MTPRYWSNSESKISACRPASRPSAAECDRRSSPAPAAPLPGLRRDAQHAAGTPPIRSQISPDPLGLGAVDPCPPARTAPARPRPRRRCSRPSAPRRPARRRRPAARPRRRRGCARPRMRSRRDRGVDQVQVVGLAVVGAMVDADGLGLIVIPRQARAPSSRAAAGRAYAVDSAGELEDPSASVDLPADVGETSSR